MPQKGFTVKQSKYQSSTPLLLGIDIGTSGIRACIVERVSQPHVTEKMTDKIVFQASVSLAKPIKTPESGASIQSANLWITALDELMAKLANTAFIKRVEHIILDATSSSVLLCDAQYNPLTQALMYDDQQAKAPAKMIASILQTLQIDSGAQGVSSTLAKVLFLCNNHPLTSHALICHQIDFVNHYLCDFEQITDENNALKLGYDSLQQTWPEWLAALLADNNFAPPKLPSVVKPGVALGWIKPQIAQQYGLSPATKLYAGTTDSIAGFLASGAALPGEAVTSLGSSLAIKMISERPIFNAKQGVYSHKLGQYWLVGGASNTGGAVLLQYYTLEEIGFLSQSLEALAQAERAGLIETALQNEYYPLPSKGERFPIADSNLISKMPPKPSIPLGDLSVVERHDPTILTAHLNFFLGILSGLTRVETMAYEKLQELGAPKLTSLFSVGGGTQNKWWMQLRAIKISAESKDPISRDAAYGVTRLIQSILKE